MPDGSGLYGRPDSDPDASAIAVHCVIVIDGTQRLARVQTPRKGPEVTRLVVVRREDTVGNPRLPMISSFDTLTPGFS
jgi:hypothetical protein